MKIGLLTFYTKEYQKLADMVMPNKNEYCTKRGYEHIVKIGPHKDANLYYAIDRLFYIYDLLFTNNYDLDAVWILNVQSLITNYDKKIEDLIEEKFDSLTRTFPKPYDFFISKDVGGLNAGSFIVRKSDWNRTWLQLIMTLAPSINHCHHEQWVMQLYHDKPQFINNIKLLKQNDLNSYDYTYYAPNWGITTPGHWQPGDLALSFPGMDLNKRLIEIPKHFDKIDKGK